MTQDIIKTGEVDMLRDLFTRFANTVTQASELAVQMEAARKDLDSLRNEIALVREQNRVADAELADVREARDKARRERDDYERENTSLRITLSDLTQERSTLSDKLKAAESAIERISEARDDYGMKALAETERADKAEAILRDLRDRLGITPVELPPITTSAPVPTETHKSVIVHQEDNQVSEAPQGYVPFSETPPTTGEGYASPVDGSGSTAGVVAEAKIEDRVYLRHSDHDAFWREPLTHQWDVHQGDWYYVKPQA